MSINKPASAGEKGVWPELSALEKLKGEDCNFKASLSHTDPDSRNGQKGCFSLCRTRVISAALCPIHTTL